MIDVRVDTHAWLPLGSLTPERVAALRATLTLHPKTFGDEEKAPILLYRETPEAFGLPRAWYEAHQDPARHRTINATSRGERVPGPLTFQGDLYDLQVQALGKITDAFYAGQYGCLLEAAPGFGKTVLACAVIAALGLKTLVVVHKGFLAKQWQKRIEAFLPGCRVGIVRGPKTDVRDKHVVIALVQTLTRRDDDLSREFGLIVTDEVHRIGAATWAPVLANYAPRFQLGLSATFRRKDGVERVFFDQIGRIVFSSKKARLTPTMSFPRTEFRCDPRMDRVSMISAMVADGRRNKLIAGHLTRALRAGRKVLVMSERIEHLRTLEEYARTTWTEGETFTVGYYLGGMKEAELAAAEKCQCIFATLQNVVEGLDIADLDTLFLTTPMTDPEQAVGRILRPHPGKQPPVVVDYQDPLVGALIGYAEKRRAWYRVFGWVPAAVA